MYEFLDWCAKDVMSAPVTIGPDATLAEAETLLEERGFNLLPVVEADGELVGVVTSLDILAAFDFNEDVILPSYEGVMKRTVREIVHTPPRTVAPLAPLTRVLRKLVDSRSRSFPVVERDRVVGVIARIDVMNALRRATSGEKPPEAPS